MFRVQSGDNVNHNNGVEAESLELAQAAAQEFATHLNAKNARAWVEISRIVPEALDVPIQRWQGGGPEGWEETAQVKRPSAMLPIQTPPAQRPFQLQAKDMPGPGESPANVVLDDGAERRAEMRARADEAEAAASGAGGPLPTSPSNGATAPSQH